MYTKKRYSAKSLLLWTRKESYVFVLVALIPTILYVIMGFTWLHLPWLPIALVGTAVAFIVGFQNNATYDRIWEARKIWGGIVNVSRTWGMMTKDMVTDTHTNKTISKEGLNDFRRCLVYRHIAWMTAL